MESKKQMPGKYVCGCELCEADGTVISTHESHWLAVVELMRIRDIEEPITPVDPELACMLENDSIGGC
jgi:hypothetical protein